MTTGTKVGIGVGCLVLFTGGLLCAGLFGGLAWFGLEAYKDVTGAADNFLAKCGSGDTAGAYASGATALHTSQTEAEFTESAKKIGLTEYQSASFNQFNVLNETGSVSGTMTKKSGETLPITVKLVKESGTWKVSSVSATTTDSSTAPAKSDPAIPSDGEIVAMSKTALMDFDEAVKADDFTSFHGKLSATWKKQITPAELKKTFQVFIDKKVDLSVVKTTAPTLNKKPVKDENGILIVEGIIPGNAPQTAFVLKFLYEHPKWKLIGISVNKSE